MKVRSSLLAGIVLLMAMQLAVATDPPSSKERVLSAASKWAEVFGSVELYEEEAPPPPFEMPAHLHIQAEGDGRNSEYNLHAMDDPENSVGCFVRKHGNELEKFRYSRCHEKWAHEADLSKYMYDTCEWETYDTYSGCTRFQQWFLPVRGETVWGTAEMDGETVLIVGPSSRWSLILYVMSEDGQKIKLMMSMGWMDTLDSGYYVLDWKQTISVWSDDAADLKECEIQDWCAVPIPVHRHCREREGCIWEGRHLDGDGNVIGRQVGGREGSTKEVVQFEEDAEGNVVHWQYIDNWAYSEVSFEWSLDNPDECVIHEIEKYAKTWLLFPPLVLPEGLTFTNVGDCPAALEDGDDRCIHYSNGEWVLSTNLEGTGQHLRNVDSGEVWEAPYANQRPATDRDFRLVGACKDQ